MATTTAAELAGRTAKLQEAMRRAGLDAALIVHNVGLYYLAGTAQSGWLYVPAQGEPLLLVRKDYERARRETAMSRVEPLKSPRELACAVLAAGYPPVATLGVEMDVLPAQDFLRYQEQFAPARLVDVAGLLRQVRAVKTRLELDLLRRTAALQERVFGLIAETLREGVSDLELMAQVEALVRRQGHLGLIRFRGLNQEMFLGATLVGEDAALPSCYDSPLGGPGLSPAFPFGGSGRMVSAGVPIMVDYGGNYFGYIIDQSRTFAVGFLPQDLLEAHRVALEIQEAVVRRAGPGVTCGELYAVAREIAERAGLGDYFMGYGPNQVPYIGHGTGLELNELPVLARGSASPLQEGMVFALEPKFVFPGRGAVGVENDWCVTRDGLERLTGFPDEVQIV